MVESVIGLFSVIVVFIVGLFIGGRRRQDPTLDKDTERLRERARALEQADRERVATEERIAEANRRLEEIANEREADESADHPLIDDVDEWNRRFPGGTGNSAGDPPR